MLMVRRLDVLGWGSVWFGDLRQLGVSWWGDLRRGYVPIDETQGEGGGLRPCQAVTMEESHRLTGVRTRVLYMEWCRQRDCAPRVR